MNDYLLIPLSAFLINGFAWTFIFSQKGSKINSAFLFYASAIALWLLSVIVERWGIAGYLILPVMKIGSIGWLTIAFLFLHFVYTFLEKKQDYLYYYSLITSVISIIINLSSGLITNGYLATFWGPDEQHNFLFIPVVIFTVCVPAFYTIYLMAIEIRDSKNINIKKSLKLMLAGSGISLAIGLFLNVILPGVFHFTSIVKVGESGTVFQSIFIFVAIIKYRLFIISSIEDVAEDIYANIQDAVVIMDANGFIIRVNAACENLFNKKIIKENKIHISSLLSNHNFNNIFQNDQKGVQINGKWKYLSLTQAAVTYQNVEKGKILIIRDETKRKEAELEIVKTKGAAEELNRLKSVFLTNMSHELRTPLISIIGYSEILMNEIADAEFKSMAEAITASGKRLVNTLNSILELSRIESNEITLNLKFKNLNELIEELVKPYRAEVEKKGISFELNFSKEDIDVVIDKRLFEAVLNHLLSNAIKYTQDGFIKVEADIEASPKGNWTVMKVSDSGAGISKEELVVIFDSFRQASEGMSRKFEGAGLGLTITKRFIELMKGSISVVSELGKGTTFTIKLPHVQREKRITKEALDNHAELIQNESNDRALPEVLLIDDDSVSIFIIRDVLKDVWQVEVCILPETAVLLASRTIYTAVMINYSANNSSSKLDVIAKIKAQKDYKQIPFIAIISSDSDKEQLLKYGFTHIIRKPISAEKFSSILQHSVK